MKRYLFFIWIIFALGALFYFSNLFGTDIPPFTLIWLVLPFLAVLISGENKIVGFCKVKFSEFMLVLLLNIIFMGIVFVILEPLSGTYKIIIDKALRTNPLDPAFYWISQYKDWSGVLGFFLINIFIIIFAEELFFRGLLIQYIGLKLNTFWGVLISSFLFLFFIVILNYNLPPVENYILLVGYTFFGRGIIGGWAAARTGTIWPSIITSSLVYTAIVFMYFYYPIYF
ncbi:MAG TPA: CPBP family intramembrane glutamic endopeptidase [Halanaerobiales bacterium]|nr:CPBP family intramembrane glutamic endopeptidase [Halanaerobiales bacterium]